MMMETLVEGLDQKPKLVCVRSDDCLLVERDRPNSTIVYESLAHQRSRRAMDPFVLTVSPDQSVQARGQSLVGVSGKRRGVVVVQK